MTFFCTKIYAANINGLKNPQVYDRALEMVSGSRRDRAMQARNKASAMLSVGAELLAMYAVSNVLKMTDKEGREEKACFFALPKTLEFADFENIMAEELPRLETVYGKHGKPELKDRPDIHFNVSHSAETVICAVSPAKVGCDIEIVRKESSSLDAERHSLSRTEKIARRFFTGSEQAWIARGGDFFRIWTLKESFMKATGFGLVLKMKDFDIRIGTQDGNCEAADNIQVFHNIDDNQYVFREYNEIDGYRCALCAAVPKRE
ncbi:MAG: 4'-phosphopantetheinyl transferase family protein [Lachnospiraceae bacterium]|jgi:4'-phosphopantetheinyl transferase